MNVLKQVAYILLSLMGSTCTLTVDFKGDATNALLLIKPFLPENPCIVEAGGHHGEDTCRLKSMFPKATIHVFEPLPSSYARLVAATNKVTGVTTYPYALSSYAGITHFYVYHAAVNDGACSIDEPKASVSGATFSNKPIRVPCITVDTWARKNGIDTVDFMWLDMEGHELAALRQAVETLKTVQAIWTEVNFAEIRKGACTYEQLKGFLESQGFKEVGKIKENALQGNALFVRDHIGVDA